jgi:hypothetical protein
VNAFSASSVARNVLSNSICPNPGEIYSCKEHFPIRAISENIIYHGVTIVATIHFILVDSIDHALGSERNPIHETDNIIYKRLS